MRKLFILGTAIVVSVAMLMTSCKKEEVNNNGNNSNTENPGGGGSGGGSCSGGGTGSANTDYPSTAIVIHNAVTDIDGNRYDAVQIGNQVWMAENLRTTRYSNGTSIPLGSTWSSTEPYRYAPGTNQSNEGNMTNVARYGYLYNWPAVMHGASSSGSNPSHVQGICPTGWHVPSDAEWTQLENYVSSQSQYVCGGHNSDIAKALASTTGWHNVSDSYYGTCAVGNDPSSNNATGFSAFPAGGYYGGYYNYFGHLADFWSATEYSDYYAYYRNLYYYNAGVYRYYDVKSSGFSVRCLRD